MQQQLLEFHVLVIEGLDRLSRDMAEQETIVRRLEFRGVRIIGVADGYDWRCQNCALSVPEPWQAVKTRQKRPQAAGGSRSSGKAARHLLSGILRCSECGGPMIAVNTHSYGCSNRLNRGTCDFRHTVTREIAETRILELVRRDLLSDAAITALKAEVRRLLRETPDQAEQVIKRRQALQRKISNLTHAIAEVGISAALKQRLQAAELELSGLEIPRPAPDFIPGLVDRYRAAIDDLRNVPQARGMLSDLLGEVPLTFDGIGLVAELGGVYSGVLARVASVKW